MKNTIVLAALAASIVTASGVVQADDTNPVTHPVVAYDKHEVKELSKELNKDATQVTATDQSMKDQKEFLDQRRTEYEKSLKENGSESDITKDALKKYKEAEKQVHKSAHKHHKAVHEMNEDQKDLNHAKHELNEDVNSAR